MAKSICTTLMLTLLLCGCGGGGSSSPVTLAFITVSPNTMTIAPGTTTPFTASGTFSDGTAVDITDTVTWSSSNPVVATVSNAAGSQGIATGISAGTSTITATSGGVSGGATLTVASVTSITVSPSPVPLIVGTNQQFTASATLSNNQTQTVTSLVTWSSVNAGVAGVSATGLATGVSLGTTQIVASLGGVSGSANVNVVTLLSVDLSPSNPSVDAGASQQFSALGHLSDATTRDVTTLLTWNSSNTTVATINANGLASGLFPGTSTISASFQGAPVGSTLLTVLPPTSITVTPANPSIVAGASQQFTATGNFADGSARNLTNLVTWSSSQLTVATISNLAGSRGLATATATASGSTIITATLGSGAGAVAGSTSLSAKTLSSLAITPANPTVVRGDTIQFAATGTFTDGTTQNLTSSVTWSSTATSVASISNVTGTKGLASGLNLGNTTIRATLGNVIGTTTLTVSATPVTPPTNRAYVTNFGDNTVSVIDTAGAAFVTAIPVGLGPRGIAVNAASNRAYVANDVGTLSVIDIASNTVVATVTLQGGGGSWGVAVLPSANRVYVANSFGRTLSVVDTTSNTLVTNVSVGATPRGVAVNPASNLVYVANSGDNTISVVNATSNLVVATIPNVGLTPQEIALNPSTSRAYVANSASNIVSVINTASNTVISTIPIETPHQGIEVNPATNRLYVSSSDATVSVIDTTSNTPLAPQFSPVIVGPNPLGIAVKAATNQVLVVNNGNNTLSIINTANDINSATAVSVGSAPTHVAVIP